MRNTIPVFRFKNDTLRSWCERFEYMNQVAPKVIDMEESGCASMYFKFQEFGPIAHWLNEFMDRDNYYMNIFSNHGLLICFNDADAVAFKLCHPNLEYDN